MTGEAYRFCAALTCFILLAAPAYELDKKDLLGHWGSPATEQGRSCYSLSNSSELQVIDSVLTEDGWREFLSAVYRRSIQTEVRQD